jgi:hypothetical protein
MTGNLNDSKQQMMTRSRLLITKIRESIPRHLSLRDYLVNKLRNKQGISLPPDKRGCAFQF